MTAERLLVVVGPTASGKTELALEWCAENDGEIVSADSVQIYRRFDIGSGKPSPQERARVPHHLIDIADPPERLDAARFAALADQAIADVRQRGKRPVVCGGTFLWIKALLFGLSGAPPADEAVRARHRELEERLGAAALHAELAAVDPKSASRLNPNDVLRVSRALEVFELSGRSQTDWHAEHGFRAPRYEHELVGVRRSPEELDRRIAARARAMFDAGWLDEVQTLLTAGFGDSRPMLSVGYRQLRDAWLSGEPIDLDSLLATVIRATRIFARRQRTWLRDQPVSWR